MDLAASARQFPACGGGELRSAPVTGGLSNAAYRVAVAGQTPQLILQSSNPAVFQHPTAVVGNHNLVNERLA